MTQQTKSHGAVVDEDDEPVADDVGGVGRDNPDFLTSHVKFRFHFFSHKSVIYLFSIVLLILLITS